jgi:hypothetical protein
LLAGAKTGPLVGDVGGCGLTRRNRSEQS